MAISTLNTAHYIEKWDSSFLSEYVRTSRFKPYMGKATGKGANSSALILIRNELMASGKTINIPLSARATGGGVQGYTRLEGNEEALAIYNDQISIHYNRNAFVVSEPDEHWTEMDLRENARMRARVWGGEAMRDDIIIAFADVFDKSWVKGRDVATIQSGGTQYTPTSFMAALNADQTSMDAWLLANRDRVLYGPDLAHLEADSDHSDSVVKLTASTDKASATTLRLAKRLAQTADAHIHPTAYDDAKGREFFVWFVGSDDFGNLELDADIKAANTDARVRGVEDHPIFQDGDLLYKGVIIREVPEIPRFGSVGASSAPVTMSFFCGAQALGVAWGQKPKSISQKDDYDFFTGLGIQEARGVKKLKFNGKQHGVVTVFSTAA